MFILYEVELEAFQSVSLIKCNVGISVSTGIYLFACVSAKTKCGETLVVSVPPEAHCLSTAQAASTFPAIKETLICTVAKLDHLGASGRLSGTASIGRSCDQSDTGTGIS